MLRKLLKYDLKYNCKVLVIFYALAIFFATLTRIFGGVENSFIADIIAKICGGVTISMIFNILINNVMRLWVRFRQNLYGDESYLTHTLPVTRETLYLSKVLNAIITILVSFVVMLASLLLAYGTENVLDIVKELLKGTAEIFDIKPFVLLLLLAFVLCLEIFNAVQCGYLGIILGHRSNQNKLGLSVLFGFGVYLVSQWFVVILTLAVALFDKDFMNLFVTNEMISMNTVKVVIAMAIFTYIAVAIIGYVVSNSLFKKGVNVE